MIIRLLALTLIIALPAIAADDAPSGSQSAQVRDPAGNRVHVALVFDDGPFPEHAPKLVSLFSEQKIHVTFSFVGTKVLAHPETARQVADAGHEIANHSYSHRHARDLDDAGLESEIADTQKIIGSAVGKTPRWYWPVFVEIDDRVRAAAAQAGVGVYVAQHLVVSKDYSLETGAEEIKKLATSDISDGTTILFHEWREETLQQLPAILAELRRQACVFLTFSEMDSYLRGRGPSEQHHPPPIGDPSGRRLSEAGIVKDSRTGPPSTRVRECVPSIGSGPSHPIGSAADLDAARHIEAFEVNDRDLIIARNGDIRA